MVAVAVASMCTLNSLAQLTTESLNVDGQTRSYLKYLPVNLNPSEELPLMLCFHSGSGTAQDQLAVGDLCRRSQWSSHTSHLAAVE